jgi:transglutaminase-like putative cysteine protease
MKLQRLLVVLMVLIQGVTLWHMMQLWFLSALIFLCALVGLFLPIRLNPDRDRRVIIGLIVGMFFAVLWRFALPDVRQAVILGSNQGVALALYFMALQAMQLYYHHPERLPPWLPLCGVAALTFSGDVTSTEAKVNYFGLCLAFSFLSAVYFSAARSEVGNGPRRVSPKWKYGMVLILMVVASAFAWYTGRFLVWAEEPVTRLAMGLPFEMPEPALGNTRNSRIGSIPNLKKEHGEKIALRIFSDVTPGYLRGQVYTDFSRSTWQYRGNQQEVEPTTLYPKDIISNKEGERVFGLDLFGGRTDPDVAVSAFEIWPEKNIRTALFLPRGTGWLGIEAEALLVDEFGGAESLEALKGKPYRPHATEDTKVVTLGAMERQAFTALPGDLHPDIRALADRVCGGQTTTLGKLNAVTQYFTGSYHYEIGIQVPAGQDSLEYFLLSEPLPDAHCEYFASGAALLLRCVGVPCRYVTGVVSMDQHPFGGYWIARNRDAHAWVEAFDETTGHWVIVEATPGDGVPGEEIHNKTSFRDAWDAFVFQVKQFIRAVRDGDWAGGIAFGLGILWFMVVQLFTSWLGLALLVVIAVIGWRRGWWHRWLRRKPKARPEAAHLVALGGILARMDRRLFRGYRLARGRDETLHRFAGRIETEQPEVAAVTRAAGWYRDYARIRYAPAVKEADVEELKRGVEEG